MAFKAKCQSVPAHTLAGISMRATSLYFVQILMEKLQAIGKSQILLINCECGKLSPAHALPWVSDLDRHQRQEPPEFYWVLCDEHHRCALCRCAGENRPCECILNLMPNLCSHLMLVLIMLWAVLLESFAFSLPKTLCASSLKFMSCIYLISLSI